MRVAAQPGNPPEKFYTNASEPKNVLKLKVDRKPQSLPVFVDHVQELASAQEKNIERASYFKQKSLVKKHHACNLSELTSEAALHDDPTQSTTMGATAKESGGDYTEHPK